MRMTFSASESSPALPFAAILQGDRIVGVERAVLVQRLQRREATAAGDDGEALTVIVGVVGAGDEVLQQPVGLDGGLELFFSEVVGRGLAHVLGRECEPAERDFPDERLGRGSDVVHGSLRR